MYYVLATVTIVCTFPLKTVIFQGLCFLLLNLSSGFDIVSIVHILATVNTKVLFLITFVRITKKEVHILDTLDRILCLLKEQHKTQKQLMDFLGLGKTAFTGWKNGDNVSYKKHIDKIAEFFNVSTDYLLGKTEIREPLSDTLPKDKNIIKIAGRDGSFVERRLTDDQLDLFKKMIEQLPDADDL